MEKSTLAEYSIGLWQGTFFEHYAPYVEPIFKQQHVFLVDYLQESLSICQRLIGHEFPIHFSEKYVEDNTEVDFDLRSAISPKESLGNLAGFSPKPY